MSRTCFFDPLYDYVTFEEADSESQRSIFQEGWGRMGNTSDSPKKLVPFLSTLEFNRLAFLRQSNLAFLLYPSSTHTRLAHAIGCCYLGYLSASEIIITEEHSMSQTSDGETIETSHLLNQWLNSRGWKEEFLLALLLHDIGHFAFSHTMESNNSLWKTLGFKLSHEDVAHQFFSGEGMAASAIREKYAGLNNYQHISEVFNLFAEINYHIISYLIRGNLDDIRNGFSPKQQLELKMLHELTSGVLDLDRIDHYRRDSYFSGIKFASNLNFSILLNGLSIKYNESGYEIRLSNEAIGHALTLLHAKERLIHDCFENPPNIAFEIMLHHALNLFLFNDQNCESNGKQIIATEEQKKKAINLLLCTDEEMLIRMENGDNAVRQIVHQIRNRDPYSFIGRWSWTKGAIDEILLRKKIANKAKVNADFVALKMVKEFGRREASRPKEWLQLDSLFDAKGCKLEQHPEYSRQIKYFKAAQEETSNVLWVFSKSKDSSIINNIKEAVKTII